MNATTAEHTARIDARNYRECAARARDLAKILRARAEGHPHRDVLLVLIGHLCTAAEGFEAATPLVIEGVTVTNATPSEAHHPLLMAQCAAADYPEAGVSEAVIAYVTAPITGRTRRLEPLPAPHPVARQDAQLRARIALAEHDLATEGDPATRYVLLATLVKLHGDRLDLGASVLAD